MGGCCFPSDVEYFPHVILVSLRVFFSIQMCSCQMCRSWESTASMQNSPSVSSGSTKSWPCHFCQWHSSWSGTVEEFSRSCQLVKEVVQISSCNIWWVWSKICAELVLHCQLTLSLSLQNFSKIAKPMTKLLCKGKRYSWSSDYQSTFDELKKKLTTAPILTPPDESHPF